MPLARYLQLAMNYASVCRFIRFTGADLPLQQGPSYRGPKRASRGPFAIAHLAQSFSCGGNWPGYDCSPPADHGLGDALRPELNDRPLLNADGKVSGRLDVSSDPRVNHAKTDCTKSACRAVQTSQLVIGYFAVWKCRRTTFCKAR